MNSVSDLITAIQAKDWWKVLQITLKLAYDMSDQELLERDNERLAAALARLVAHFKPCGWAQGVGGMYCVNHGCVPPCPVEEARRLLGGRGA